MELVLFEDRIKYDFWVKIVLVFPIIFLLALGILFYIDAHYRDVIPSESESDSNTAAIIIFASVPFVLVVYWLSLPRKIYVLQDRIKLKIGEFFWNVPFETIESVKPAKGIIVWRGFSSITSYSTQIEIIRSRGQNIRISPSRREQLLDCMERAMSDWKRVQGGSASGET
ncbi:MAG: hypothetical protein GTO17_02425 [Candidatus Aminicenantes bacterium]|nr:hypothetical protein [Candidatus Aminicenantes bacterium]